MKKNESSPTLKNSLIQEVTGDGKERISGKETGVEFPERNELFASVFQSNPVALAIIQAGNGIFRDINKSFERLLGFSGEELIGKRVTEFNFFVYHSQREEIRRAIREMGKIENMECSLLTRDGRIVEALYSMEQIAVNDQKLYLGSLINISDQRRAENELQKSENQFRVLIQNLHSAVALVDENGNFIIVNPLFLKMFELSEDSDIENINSPFWGGWQVFDSDGNLLAPEEHPVRKALTRGVRIDNQVVGFRCPSGIGIKWMLASAAPIFYEDGRISRLICTFYDITERKIAEEELFKSEQKLRYHLENSPIAVIEWNSDYIVTQWSKEAEKTFGWKAEETLGKPINALNMIYEEDLPVVNQTMKKLSGGKELTVISSNRNYTKSREVRDCIWYNSVLLDNKGKMSSVLSLVEDITDRIRMAKEVKESEERLLFALENGNIGIWEWDLKTSEASWDERVERMFGLEKAAFGKTLEDFEELVNEEDLPHIRRSIKEAMKKGTHFETIFRTNPRAGNTRYLATKAMVSMDNDGIPSRFTGVCIDITELQKGTENLISNLNEELLRSNRELENFAYVASHDLQEPLRMVTSFTQLLERKYIDKLDQNAREYIHYAVDGATRMYDLLNGLLTYSRINTRGNVFAPVSVKSVIESVIKNLDLVIKEKEAEIIVGKMPVIYADSSQMTQLFQNLISNSLKFSTDKPRVTISSRKENKKVYFSVKDEGMGIEPQYFDRIFQIFRRLLPKEEYEGTGIGLAICKRIVERHRGTIWVESEYGKGSTFHIMIPEDKPG